MQNKDLSWLTARPIAHRGYHDDNQGLVENCRASFKAAIEQNYAIELDVQLTKDGKAAVFHDSQLDRLTRESGYLCDLTMAELAKAEFKQGADHIEELPDILALIGDQVPVVIELKAPATKNEELEKQVARNLEDYQGRAAVMSFDPRIVAHLANLTDRPRGIVSCDYFKDEANNDLSDDEKYKLTHLLHAPITRPDFISYDVTDLPVPSADLLKSLYDLPIICWTTRDAAMHHHALQFCDQVTFEGYNPDNLP